MKYYVFRNYTVESFFRELTVSFSGYEDISQADNEADAYIWFYLPPFRNCLTAVADTIAHYGNQLDWILTRLDADKPFLIFLMQPIYHISYQTIDRTVEEAIEQYNRKVRRIADNNTQVKIVPLGEFLNQFSAKEQVDWKFFFLSQIPINPKLSSAFTTWFQRQLEITQMQRKKCIVLDLDNTLWGGVLGEDGLEGIRIGEDYPGNAFLFFQDYLLELSKNGVMLAVCSKNNETDVVEVWEKHPNLLIRKEHLVAYRINWNHKAGNIQEIARELNIGLESLVFIDDQPSERELVRQLLPQVAVPDFPEQPYLFPEFIKKLTADYFSTYRLTEEDLTKTQQYQENTQRRQLQNQFADFKSFLRSLEIDLTIEPLSDINISRLAQMTQKTNQFNLTTPRYSETDIRQLASQGAWVYGLRVKDRLGDQGLTGLFICKIHEKSAEIDTFLLSCRVLGKEIETAFIQYMLQMLQSHGIREVKASYIATSKNSQVADFYDKVGFLQTQASGTSKSYLLPLDSFTYEPSDIYKIRQL